jgi:hypothetical protein
MALRRLLYLLGASLTTAGCFFPWSCQQVGDLSWRCSTAIILRYSMHDSFTSRIEIQDNVRGSGFIVLLLTAVIILFALSPPQFAHRPKIIVVASSAALVLVSTYHFINRLNVWIQGSGVFMGVVSLTLAIVCAGALMMLACGLMDQRAIRQHPA